MYLKSLTLRGFKSFASSTTLVLEPGITAVVGPNGSGKSNVVDALSWVMGEQGAKTLRGGKMEDVIFAGTSGRAPLGRAEVVLTIDNSDGALPIEYTEVTISRTMFRSGGSEYAINGNTCRLLDVQELLSDSGIGREMHVIVGQGQLDSVLRATPEERRGFIEEAAGVLKHRKRKEKALRKLDATQGNLTRLNDLLTELRRQLKPLGRQAEVARRAAGIQATVRDARARLLADDIVIARSTMETELADEGTLRARREEVEQLLAAARLEETGLEELLAADAPKLLQSQEVWHALGSLRERFLGTANLARERVRRASEDGDQSRLGRDPEDMENEARNAEQSLVGLREAVEKSQALLNESIAGRSTHEEAHALEQERVSLLARASADRREGIARLHGQLNGLKSRLASAEEEIERLVGTIAKSAESAESAQREFTTLESTIASLSAGEGGLDEAFEAAEAELHAAESVGEKLTEQLRDAEQRLAAVRARKEALELTLSSKDASGAMLEGDTKLEGLLGSVSSFIKVKAGWEPAIAAALGATVDGVALGDIDSAVSALKHLRSEDLGQTRMLVADAPLDASEWPQLPNGAVWAHELVTVPKEFRGAIQRVLHLVAVVHSLDEAQALVGTLPDVTAVTSEGDRVAIHLAEGGSGQGRSIIEISAAVEAAGIEEQEISSSLTGLTESTTVAQERVVKARASVDVSLAKLHESDAEMSAVAERLGSLGQIIRSAGAERDRLQEATKQAELVREQSAASITEIETRIAQAEDGNDEEPQESRVEELAQAASLARRAETEARLALRTDEERARALDQQVRSLYESAQAERLARQQARELAERRRVEAETAAAVLSAIDVVLARIARSLDQAAEVRAAVQATRTDREAQLKSARVHIRELATELEKLTDSVHKDELARAQLQLKLETLEERALEEVGIDVETLVAEYGPDQLVLPVSGEAEDAEPVAFDRNDQAKRLKIAERELALLGKVNPLALEEFSALEERHQFLSEQLDDLKKTREDLLEIVEEVDQKVEQVFTEAWYDVEREFEDVFSRLFPGGEGRLILTDPSSMLTTGIDVEARPPGKKVKRLSLLSGGERSLVAVAFLVALFKARPSPFYILDEVEAALDDTNLGRLLEIYEELRANSQLIVITHQKRTMEVADALYGVSMRGDGVSAVISQRLREEEAD
ncbi:MAG: chromosome segregation protein SMC [Actinomycetales bacterium]|nr:chromosome segregation protein SMC [Actinomycetales bacterium]